MKHVHGSGDLHIIKASDSTRVAPDSDVDGTVTLPAGTYYAILGASNAPLMAETALVSAHFKWSAPFAATITYEESNFPRHRGGSDQGAIDVSNASATAGDWIQENPSTASVATSGTGNSATALTITAGGTAAGGAFVHIGNNGARRGRFKIVVTIQGTIRCCANAKVGS